jgi:hypothetical protein
VNPKPSATIENTETNLVNDLKNVPKVLPLLIAHPPRFAPTLPLSPQSYSVHVD